MLISAFPSQYQRTQAEERLMRTHYTTIAAKACRHCMPQGGFCILFWFHRQPV